MKKLLALLLALPALAFATPVSVTKDTVTNALLYSGFKVPSAYTIEFQSGSTLLIDAGATFNFPAGSINWSSITGTPTTLVGYGIVNAQGLNANLTALAGLVSAANQLPYFTGSGTASLASFTAFGQSLAATSNAGTAQTLLTLVPGTNVQAYSATLNAVASGTYTGAASITTLGTITTGTWTASPINLASYVSGILPGANGGTGNGFFAVTGPTGSLATFTFPNASASVLTTNALVTPGQGGDGVNNSTFTETRAGNVIFSGAFSLTLTSTAATNVTLPTSGTLATLSNTETLTNKTIDGFTLTALGTGFSVAAGTTSKTLTVSNTLTLAGTDTSTLNIGAGGTLGSAAFTASGAYQTPLTFTTGLTNSAGTVTVNASQSISTLSNLTTNGVVTTSGGVGTLVVNVPTGSGSVVEATGPAISAITNLGVRDTSAAFDVVIGATSSVTLTANRALTIDTTNVARTLKFTGNAVLNQDVSTAASPTFITPAVTSITLGVTTPSTLAGTNGSITLTAAGTNQSITMTPSGTGSVVFPVGAAATPGLDFTGDVTTGIYHPAVSQIGFAIAGVGVGNVTATGLNSMAVGATSTSTGAFTTLSATGLISGAGFSAYLGSPPAIGGTAAAAGTFTTLTATSTLSVTGSSTLTGIVTVGSASGGQLIGNPTAGINAADIQLTNTGGVSYFGIGNSTGSTFSTGNYAAFVYTPTEFDVLIGGVNLLKVLAAGISTPGTLSVTGTSTLTGDVGIGGASVATSALAVFSTLTGTSSLTGLTVQPAFTAGANNQFVFGYYSAPTFNNSSYTGLTAYNMYLGTPTKTGTWSVSAQLYLAAASAATTTYGFYQAGTDQNVLNGSLTVNAALSATGTATLGASTGLSTTILGAAAPNANNIALLEFLSSNTQYNWFVDSNDTTPGVFEIAPSTVGGGTTRGTPVFTLTQAGNFTATGTGTITGNVTTGNGGATVNSVFTMNGGAATNYGSEIIFQRNAVQEGQIGNDSVLTASANNGVSILTANDSFRVYTNGANLALSITTAQLGQWNAAEADKFTNLTYATTISVNPALGNTFETTTVNATGNATINFSSAGTAGQEVKLIIINDATSGKTMTWGTNLRPASTTLVGVTSKASTIWFQSDGTSFFEMSRETGNL